MKKLSGKSKFSASTIAIYFVYFFNYTNIFDQISPTLQRVAPNVKVPPLQQGVLGLPLARLVELVAFNEAGAKAVKIWPGEAEIVVLYDTSTKKNNLEVLMYDWISYFLVFRLFMTWVKAMLGITPTSSVSLWEIVVDHRSLLYSIVIVWNCLSLCFQNASFKFQKKMTCFSAPSHMIKHTKHYKTQMHWTEQIKVNNITNRLGAWIIYQHQPIKWPSCAYRCGLYMEHRFYRYKSKGRYACSSWWTVADSLGSFFNQEILMNVMSTSQVSGKQLKTF